jgi:hypothetical protein
VKSVSRSIAAYLLWLFVYIRFNNHGSCIYMFLLQYAHAITNVEEDHVLLVSWGSVILAATY